MESGSPLSRVANHTVSAGPYVGQTLGSLTTAQLKRIVKMKADPVSKNFARVKLALNDLSKNSTRYKPFAAVARSYRQS